MIYPKKNQEKNFFQMINYLEYFILAAVVFKSVGSLRSAAWPIGLPALTVVSKASVMCDREVA